MLQYLNNSIKLNQLPENSSSSPIQHVLSKLLKSQYKISQCSKIIRCKILLNWLIPKPHPYQVYILNWQIIPNLLYFFGNLVGGEGRWCMTDTPCWVGSTLLSRFQFKCKTWCCTYDEELYPPRFQESREFPFKRSYQV